MAKYEKLVAFVEGLGVIHSVARGGRLLVNLRGNSLVEPILISVNELFKCKTSEEIWNYLGSHVILVVFRRAFISSLFADPSLFFVSGKMSNLQERMQKNLETKVKKGKQKFVA